MAYELDTCFATFVAGADLSALQWTAVKLDSTADQVVAAGAGEAAIGVLIEPGSASGDQVKVALFSGSGIVKGMAGAATTAGGPLAVETATGRFIDATGGDIVVGHGIEAGADGQIISIVPMSYVAPA